MSVTPANHIDRGGNGYMSGWGPEELDARYPDRWYSMIWIVDDEHMAIRRVRGYECEPNPREQIRWCPEYGYSIPFWYDTPDAAAVALLDRATKERERLQRELALVDLAIEARGNRPYDPSRQL